jgi:hypothetical protein
VSHAQSVYLYPDISFHYSDDYGKIPRDAIDYYINIPKSRTFYAYTKYDGSLFLTEIERPAGTDLNDEIIADLRSAVEAKIALKYPSFHATS